MKLMTVQQSRNPKNTKKGNSMLMCESFYHIKHTHKHTHSWDQNQIINYPMYIYIWKLKKEFIGQATDLATT